jgi:sugar phosphate isomerase/epimerase
MRIGLGYDDVLSIEHEDLALPPIEGVHRSVDLLREAITPPSSPRSELSC